MSCCIIVGQHVNTWFVTTTLMHLHRPATHRTMDHLFHVSLPVILLLLLSWVSLLACKNIADAATCPNLRAPSTWPRKHIRCRANGTGTDHWSSRANFKTRDTTRISNSVGWVTPSWTVGAHRSRDFRRFRNSNRYFGSIGRASGGMSMKVKSRPGGRASSKQRIAVDPRKQTKALYIQVEDLASDSWRLVEAAEILRRGGVGVIPTDTCYTFACDILSRKGVERILQIKSQQGQKKPLSLLCKDISTMSTYATGINKALFKTMKAALPGPFTFILPSNNEVPRMLLDHKHHKKTWKRREIGVRMPDAPVLMELLHQLDGPLLCSSVPSNAPTDGSEADYSEGEHDDQSEWEDNGEDENGGRGPGIGGGWGDDALVSGDPGAIERTWGHAVDFVVDAGFLEVGGFSTVVDALGSEPIVLREGLGDSSLIIG